MKLTKLKQVMALSALSVSMAAIMTASVSAIAATNPATAGGQTAIQNGVNTVTAGGGSPANPTGAETSQPIENGAVKDAVADCPLQETAATAIAEAMEVVNIKPDIDAIFNDKTEATQGCFAASSKVINLAMEIPSVTLPWSNTGALVKKQIEKMLLQKQEELIAKGCEIADNALLSALEPVQQYLNDMKSKSGQFNGMIGNIDLSGTGYGNPDKGLYENASQMIKDKIDGSLANIDAAGIRMADIQKIIDDKYKGSVTDDTFNTPPIAPEPTTPLWNSYDANGAAKTANTGGSTTQNSRTLTTTPSQQPTVGTLPTQNVPAPTFSNTPAPSSSPSGNPYGATQSGSASNPF